MCHLHMDGKVYQAVIHPNILLLSRIVQDGRYRIVTLDLLNCKEVPSVDSPTRSSAKMMLAQMLQRHRSEGLGLMGWRHCAPYQSSCSNGVEQLGAESASEVCTGLALIGMPHWCWLFF